MSNVDRLRKTQELNRTVNLIFNRIENIQKRAMDLDMFSPCFEKSLIQLSSDTADLMRLNAIIKDKEREKELWTKTLMAKQLEMDLENTYSVKTMFGSSIIDELR